jgi:DNA replication initiation complex subunit (GINS family)
MPYDVLESQIKSLPEAYYNELVDYLEFLLQKADKEKKSLEKVRESSLQTVWETIKDDTW